MGISFPRRMDGIRPPSLDAVSANGFLNVVPAQAGTKAPLRGDDNTPKRAD
jgi:hypothetical protein